MKNGILMIAMLLSMMVAHPVLGQASKHVDLLGVSIGMPEDQVPKVSKAKVSRAICDQNIVDSQKAINSPNM